MMDNCIVSKTLPYNVIGKSCDLMKRRNNTKCKHAKPKTVKLNDSPQKVTIKHEENIVINDYFQPKVISSYKKDVVDLAVDVVLDLQNPLPICKESYKHDKAVSSENKKDPTSDIPNSTVGYLKMSPYGKGTTVKSDSTIACHIKNEISSTKMLKNIDTSNCNAKQSYFKCSKPQKTAKCAKPMKNEKLTDYFPVRRSSRKTKSVIKKEKEDKLISDILSNKEDDLEVVEFSDKGRGVTATRNILKDDFVVEYSGDLITWAEAKQRELTYADNSNIGCYMYYFNAKGQSYCIDATAESGRLGRLLNHSRRNPNCYTRLVWIPEKSGAERPHLVIMAKRDIKKDEELVYDYGDRDKSALAVHPWLKS